MHTPRSRFIPLIQCSRPGALTTPGSRFFSTTVKDGRTGNLVVNLTAESQAEPVLGAP